MVVKATKRTVTRKPNASERLSARDRLLAAADELFYSEGVHVVGIDRIVERAGVAKASLYSTFGSKEELVRAYLDKHFRNRQRRIERILAAHKTPREKLLGVFAEFEVALAGSEFRGCRFIMASAEARADDASEVVAEEYRSWLLTLFTDLVRAAGAKDAKRLGRQLALLYDGAAVAARMDHDRRGAASAMRSAVGALLDAAIRPKRQARR
ncbi:MAG TPA: helix-turn-helix domain-containing protein [Candidatus Eisenbacteria bacterium]|nr:helix-turn-helix domain-containing protein [Candidatus Eisenbacteria bacterium]